MDQSAMQVDVMVEEALRRARSWRPTQSEAKRVRSARGALRRLTSASPRDAIFNSIRDLLPFAAGLIDVLPAGRPDDPANLVHDVPESFLAERAQFIGDDPSIPLAMALPAGLSLRGPDAMPNGAFYRDPYCQKVYSGRHGLDNVTGMILSPKESALERKVVVLWLFSGSGSRVPTWDECRLLDHVSGDLWTATERARLPLIPHERMHFQVLQEQNIGYVLLREDGVLLEVNRRAVLLSRKYSAGATASWRACVHELIAAVRAAAQRGSQATRSIQCSDGSGALELNLHRLAKEAYDIGQDALLIEMRETLWDRSAAGGAEALLSVLPPRQRQIAGLLIETGLSYKEIADELSLSTGTVRKHVERVHRTLRVRSRAELVAKARKHHG